jgi:hypothetical protein
MIHRLVHRVSRKRERHEVACGQCGLLFESRIRRGVPQKYCSHTCASEAQRDRAMRERCEAAARFW